MFSKDIYIWLICIVFGLHPHVLCSHWHDEIILHVHGHQGSRCNRPEWADGWAGGRWNTAHSLGPCPTNWLDYSWRTKSNFCWEHMAYWFWCIINMGSWNQSINRAPYTPHFTDKKLMGWWLHICHFFTDRGLLGKPLNSPGCFPWHLRRVDIYTSVHEIKPIITGAHHFV